MTTDQSDLTGQTLPDAAHVDAAGGETAAEQSLSLAELEQTLGKKFPDKATALKAVKDTFSYVGEKKAAADPAPAQDPAILEKLSSLENEVFYAKHPEYNGHESIIKAMGSDPAKVIESDAFKTYFEKAKVADEVAQTRSVVSSSQRLAQTTSTREEAAKIANAPGSSAGSVADYFGNKLSEAISQQQ